MSKILLINGSPNARGCTFTALREISLALAAEGVESEILWLGKEPIADCIACGQCAEAGQCVFDDLVNRIAKVEDAVNVGDIVRVKVLDVNTEAKRISLSIREVLEDEALDSVPDDEFAIDDIPEA